MSVSKAKEIQQKALPPTTSLWLQQVTGTEDQQNWRGCFWSSMGFEPPDQTHKTQSKAFGCEHCRCRTTHGVTEQHSPREQPGTSGYIPVSTPEGLSSSSVQGCALAFTTVQKVFYSLALIFLDPYTLNLSLLLCHFVSGFEGAKTQGISILS